MRTLNNTTVAILSAATAGVVGFSLPVGATTPQYAARYNATSNTTSHNNTTTQPPSPNPVYTQPGWVNMLPETMRKPCKEEDSVNCYWDAGTAGNHKGHSFVVREMPGSKHMVCVMYVARKDARKWDYCS